MKKIKFKYKILKELNLIIRFCSGQPSLDNLFDYIEITANDIDYLPTMLVLNDIRDCSIVFNEEDIIAFIKKTTKSNRLYAKRKIVFVTNTPNQVVFSSLIELFKNETLIEISITSTIEKALIDLNISEINYDLINNTLKEYRLK